MRAGLPGKHANFSVTGKLNTILRKQDFAKVTCYLSTFKCDNRSEISLELLQIIQPKLTPAAQNCFMLRN